MADTLAIFVAMNHRGVPVWAFSTYENAADFATAQDTWFHIMEVPLVQFKPMELFPVTNLNAPVDAPSMVQATVEEERARADKLYADFNKFDEDPA